MLEKVHAIDKAETKKLLTGRSWIGIAWHCPRMTVWYLHYSFFEGSVMKHILLKLNIDMMMSLLSNCNWYIRYNIP